MSFLLYAICVHKTHVTPCHARRSTHITSHGHGHGRPTEIGRRGGSSICRSVGSSSLTVARRPHCEWVIRDTKCRVPRLSLFPSRIDQRDGPQAQNNSTHPQRAREGFCPAPRIGSQKERREESNAGDAGERLVGEQGRDLLQPRADRSDHDGADTTSHACEGDARRTDGCGGGGAGELSPQRDSSRAGARCRLRRQMRAGRRRS